MPTNVTDLPLIGGKTLAQWEAGWRRVGGGFGVPHPEYWHKVGLYRAVLRGTGMAIGVGTQVPGGVEKRLSDFRRDSDHNRDHYLGHMIHRYSAELELEVLMTGSDRAAGDVARALRTAMLADRRPAWNVKPRFIPVTPSPPLAPRRRISAAHLVVPGSAVARSAI